MIVFLLAAAAQTAAPAAPATPAPAPASEKKQCRRDVATGSIMARRVCRTVAEWRAIDTATAEAARQGLDNRRLGTPVGE